MRRTGLARGQGMKLAVSSAPKARKVFVSHPRTGRRALLGIPATHPPCAKWSFWWVIFREQTWVTSRERRSAIVRFPSTIEPSLVDCYSIRRSPSHAVAEEHGVGHRLHLGQYPKAVRQVVPRGTALGAPWASQLLRGALKPTSLRLTAERLIAASRCKHGT